MAGLTVCACSVRDAKSSAHPHIHTATVRLLRIVSIDVVSLSWNCEEKVADCGKRGLRECEVFQQSLLSAGAGNLKVHARVLIHFRGYAQVKAFNRNLLEIPAARPGCHMPR